MKMKKLLAVSDCSSADHGNRHDRLRRGLLPAEGMYQKKTLMMTA